MVRISTIFVTICMVLIAASLGLVLYSMAGLSPSESSIVALTALTFLILYNAVSMRLRDRASIGNQVSDLSNGTADLARQVSDFGRRLAIIEGKVVSANSASQDRLQSVAGEIHELGGLVKHLATSVAAHEDMLTALPPAAPAPTPVVFTREPAPTVIVETDPLPATVSAVSAATVAPAQTEGSARDAEILAAVRNAVATSSIDIFLQPIVTLPQRKVRFYEAVTRVRSASGEILTGDDFIPVAEAAGLMGLIDSMVMLRCVQVLRRLLVRNKDVGVFCNVAAATLGNPTTFAQYLEILDANRTLAPSLLLEFKHDTLRNMGPAEADHLASLAQRGFRFSIDHVKDLRLDPRDLGDRGVRFIKIPASLLLEQQTASADIHIADLSDLLGRFGIDLIAERIEGERSVVDLLDYDVRFGQGFLFSAPRPLRPEAGGESADAPEKPKTVATASPQQRPRADVARVEPPRITGNAALARRAAASPG